jgi:radical SAM superfamily enzyme YgiQ (UPF0313 family)
MDSNMKIVIIICRQAQMASYHLPTGIGIVSACLKQAGHDVVMINPNHSLEKYQTLLEREIKYHKPNVVATGGMGFHLNEIRFITDIARRMVPEAIIIIGGPLVSSVPSVAMAGVPAADFGIVGEGEYSTVELLDAIETGSDITAIKGIIYRDNQNPQTLNQTASRPLIDNLDLLPMVDMEGLGVDTYASLHRPGECAPALIFDSDTRVMPLLTSRGCPFKCTFCVHEAGGQRYRCRSLDIVFSEIQHAIDTYGINAFLIYDDLFCPNPTRLKEFCHRITPLGVRWECSMVVRQINPETLKMMKESGCCCISIGVESMSPTVLKSMKKGTTVEQIELALTQIYEAEIAIWSNLIFFDPAETLQTVDESLEWFSNHPQFEFRFARIGYHPGSLIYDEAVKNGLISDQLKYFQSGNYELNATSMSTDDFGLANRLMMRTQITFGYAGKLLDCKIDKSGTVNLICCCPYCGTTGQCEFEEFIVRINCPSCNRMYRPPVTERIKPLPNAVASIDRLIQLTKTESSSDRTYEIWCQIIAIDPYYGNAWSQLLHHAEQKNNYRLYAIILRNLLLMDPYIPDSFKRMADVLTFLGFDKRATKYTLKAEHLKQLGVIQSKQIALILPPSRQDSYINNKLNIMIDMKAPLSDELFLKFV